MDPAHREGRENRPHILKEGIMSDSFVITYRTGVAVNQAQMLSLYSTPLPLLICPADYDIVIKGINVYYLTGPTNTPYAFSNPNTCLIIGYDTAPPSQASIYNGDYYQMPAAGFVDQTLENAQPLWIPVAGSGSFQTPGSNLYLTTDISALTGGDGTLLVYIDYSLTPQPL
jgi:hypothetical protein